MNREFAKQNAGALLGLSPSIKLPEGGVLKFEYVGAILGCGHLKSLPIDKIVTFGQLLPSNYNSPVSIQGCTLSR